MEQKETKELYVSPDMKEWEIKPLRPIAASGTTESLEETEYGW